MKIKLTALGKFQKYFPTRTSEVNFPGKTLPEFLTWVKEKYSLDVTGHRNIKITHNSKLVRDFNIHLEDGDRVSFIPIVAGG